uniref:C-X-C chemokine receptor type 3 n=1 Tax=Sphenodon punctatus TaxID=8508 RepID=A0A8D0L7Q8_SPHPU
MLLCLEDTTFSAMDKGGNYTSHPFGDNFVNRIIVMDDFLNYFDDDNYSNYDNNNSDTCCSFPPCSSNDIQFFEQIFLPIFYSFIFLLGMGGNVMVIAVLLRGRQILAGTDMFILHLAVADVLLVVTLPFWGFQAVYGWVFGNGMCKLVGAIFKINFYSSIFFLVCISFDRYLSIIHAVHMYKKSKSQLVVISCLVVWIICVLLTMPDFIFLQVKKDPRLNATLCFHNFNFNVAKTWKTALHFLYHVVGFLLPLAAMLYCYICIILTLLRSHGFQKHKAMRVILTVVVVFFMCWTPYHFALLINTLIDLNVIGRDCDREARLDIATAITASLGYLHCCLNPLLYAFVGVKFRNKFLEMLNQVGCVSREFLKRHGRPLRHHRDSTWSETTEASYSGL